MRAALASRSRMSGSVAMLMTVSAMALLSPTPLLASSIEGAWRITRVAPLSGESSTTARNSLIGQAVRFANGRVAGPAPLSCEQATWETNLSPPEGLFQGNFSQSSHEAAKSQALVHGLWRFPIPGYTLSCSSGLFHLHRPERATLLTAIDGQVWTLQRLSPQLLAANTPESVVQELLENWLNPPAGFEPAALSRVERWLTPKLQRLISVYFSVPGKPDDAPAINGDPFTDSQEAPARFVVSSANLNPSRTVARVRVQLIDGNRVRSIQYLLQRHGDRWQVDDVQYPNRRSMSALLSNP